MIKKLIGWCAAVAIVALLVVTVQHRDQYTSWCFNPTEEVAETEKTAEETAEASAEGDAETPAEQPDSVNLQKL